MPRKAQRRTLSYFLGSCGQLSGSGKRPFYQIKLEADALAALLSQLDSAEKSENRMWFTLVATSENPSRLRLYSTRTPAFESRAARGYLRGDVFRVSGKESCNIDFSAPVGAGLLAEQLRAAQSRMRRFVLLRIPSRKQYLIEFVPDIDLEAVESPEHRGLAEAGVALAASVWGEDDFEDWEQAGV